jgi:hypothetical protein
MTAHKTRSDTTPINEVADPHPSTEEHYERQRRPGGANPPRDDIGPNPAKHDGHSQPKPKNVESE